MRTFSANELRALPTLSVRQADDLKVDTGATRVWLCRCGVADGMPYDNQVTVERLHNGRWLAWEKYEAK